MKNIFCSSGVSFVRLGTVTYFLAFLLITLNLSCKQRNASASSLKYQETGEETEAYLKFDKTRSHNFFVDLQNDDAALLSLRKRLTDVAWKPHDRPYDFVNINASRFEKRFQDLSPLTFRDTLEAWALAEAYPFLAEVTKLQLSAAFPKAVEARVKPEDYLNLFSSLRVAIQFFNQLYEEELKITKEVNHLTQNLNNIVKNLNYAMHEHQIIGTNSVKTSKTFDDVARDLSPETLTHLLNKLGIDARTFHVIPKEISQQNLRHFISRARHANEHEFKVNFCRFSHYLTGIGDCPIHLEGDRELIERLLDFNVPDSVFPRQYIEAHLRTY